MSKTYHACANCSEKNEWRCSTENGERPQFPRRMKSMSLWPLLSAERDCCRLLRRYEREKKWPLPIKRRWGWRGGIFVSPANKKRGESTPRAGEQAASANIRQADRQHEKT